MRIGRMLKDPKLKKMFDERLKGGVTSSDKLSIVFSHNPRDIATMSTNRGWTSCADLAKGGPAAEQLHEKVQAGGMVAYLINSNDKNIERPIARIAIRRFLSISDGSFILLPEWTCYGAKVDEFEDTVEAILNKSNEQTSKDTLGIFKDAEGGYSDTFSDYADRFGEVTGLEQILDKVYRQKDWLALKDVLDRSLEHDIEELGVDGIEARTLYDLIEDAIDNNKQEPLQYLLEYMKFASQKSFINTYDYWYDEIDVSSVIEKHNVDMLKFLLNEYWSTMFSFDHLLDAMDNYVYGFRSSSKEEPEFSDEWNEMIYELLNDYDFEQYADLEYRIGRDLDEDQLETIKKYLVKIHKKRDEGFEYKENFDKIYEYLDDEDKQSVDEALGSSKG
jgi:hypothetical protein